MKEYIVRCENNKFTLECEIVHCKDCEHCEVSENTGVSRCFKFDFLNELDDYCSYGERKEKVQLSHETSTNKVDTTTNTPTDLISRQAIEYHTQLEARGNGQYEEVEVAYKSDIESFPPVEPVAESTTTTDEVVDFNNMISGGGRIRNLPPVEPKEIIRCKNCRHDNNCEIQYAAQAGIEFFCGAAEQI